MRRWGSTLQSENTVVFSDSQEYELMTHITEYERVGFRKTSLFDEAHRAKANGLGLGSLGVGLILQSLQQSLQLFHLFPEFAPVVTGQTCLCGFQVLPGLTCQLR